MTNNVAFMGVDMINVSHSCDDTCKGAYGKNERQGAAFLFNIDICHCITAYSYIRTHSRNVLLFHFLFLFSLSFVVEFQERKRTCGKRHLETVAFGSRITALARRTIIIFLLFTVSHQLTLCTFLSMILIMIII